MPSLDLAPEPGLLALDLIEFISSPVYSEASSIVSKILLLPSLNVAITLVLSYFFFTFYIIYIFLNYTNSFTFTVFLIKVTNIFSFVFSRNHTNY